MPLKLTPIDAESPQQRNRNLGYGASWVRVIFALLIIALVPFIGITSAVWYVACGMYLGLAALFLVLIRTVYLLFLVGFLLTSISKRFLAGVAAPEDKPYFDYYPYFVFEHYVRTILVALGAYYTIRRAIALRGEVSRFRVVSLVSFVASLMVFMVAIPSVWGFTGDHFMGFSYLFMPFPWLSSVLHVAHTGETYHSSFSAVFGSSGARSPS